MGGCAAINCSNHSRNKFRMFKFPADEARRKRWSINCRRDEYGWVPGPRAELCEVHFEESQFELGRADGWKKLKPNAIPTLFDVPNPPSKRIKGAGLARPGSALDCGPVDQIEVSDNSFHLSLLEKVSQLEEENKKLKLELEMKNKCLSSFLSEEQIIMSAKERSTIKKWSNESIIKGLKLRFALGKRGYSFLLSTGYPSPSHSTLNRHLRIISDPICHSWHLEDDSCSSYSV